ncbi:uncharacterized protein VTP21DRAFT_5086 [Calcarisporiella thermophila]|uniref:uncharacterized protein n=1 Tax=Calcarisporiella thermophila TaxID=911321 RepID=UPI0037421095
MKAPIILAFTVVGLASLSTALPLHKRGILDNTANNLDLIDHVEAIDSTVNSNPQDSENRNANTKASGPGDNSNLSKQGGEGIYYKGGHGYCHDDNCYDDHYHHHHHHHWRRDSENRNANTKANGPGDNSDISKQGPEGAYIKHY